jgi:hypothetical protein
MDEMNKDKDQLLDSQLDAMLAEYSAMEPRPGLENRILSNIRQANAKPPSSWGMWGWIWSGAAAAAALALLIILVSSPAPRKQPAPVAQTNSGSRSVAATEVSHPAPQKAAHQPEPARVAHARPVHKTRVVLTEVRKEVFPTPEPLSNQERMLLRYLAQTPREELLTESHPDPDFDEDLLRGRQRFFNSSANSRNSGNNN